MPIAIRVATVNANQQVAFEFDANVMSFVVGIAYWRFAFGGGDDHHVMKLGLSVNSVQPDSRRVVATAVAQLQDAHGAGIDNASSTVRLVCIAVTVAQDSNYSMSNIESVGTGSSSNTTLPLPDSSPSIAQAFLSGWNLAYSGDDHHMKRLQLVANFTRNGNTGQLSATANMSDDSGHSTVGGTISGGLFAASAAQSGLMCRMLLSKQTTDSVSVDFGKRIKAAGVMLQSLVVSFSGDDHHIKTIGGGTTDWSFSGSMLTLKNASAFMTDDSGHSQDNRATSSYVSMAAFAVPA